MERKICVSLDFLEEKHRDAIEKTAAETNFVPRFFSKRERDAATAWLQESEILYTGSLTLPAKAGASLRWLAFAYAGVDPFCRPDGPLAGKDCLLTSSNTFDVTLAAGMGQERPGPTAAHRACDKFIQSYRDKLKKFKGEKCTERHEYHDIVRPGKKRVLIVKQVAGQGAMYDTHLFAKEPSGVEGGRSIIDMGNMPVLVTPNEYRDGIIRSMQ